MVGTVSGTMGNSRMSQYIAPRSKLFFHVDRLHEIRATGNTSAPVNVEIDLSNRCQLGCEWCLTRNAFIDIMGHGKCSIADVRPGDHVIAYNEDSGTVEWSEVYAVSERNTSELLYQIVVGNDIIEATGNHRVYTKRGWVEARHLTTFDEVAYVSEIVRMRLWSTSQEGKAHVSTRSQRSGRGEEQSSQDGRSDLRLRLWTSSGMEVRDIQTRPQPSSFGWQNLDIDGVGPVRMWVRAASEDKGFEVLPWARPHTRVAPSHQRTHESQQSDEGCGCSQTHGSQQAKGKQETCRDLETAIGGGPSASWSESRGAKAHFGSHEKGESDEKPGSCCQGGKKEIRVWINGDCCGTNAQAMARPSVSASAIGTHEGEQSYDGYGDAREIAIQDSIPPVAVEAGTMVQPFLREIPVPCMVHRNGRILGKWSESRFQDTRSEVVDRGDRRLFTQTTTADGGQLRTANDQALRDEQLFLYGSNATSATTEQNQATTGKFSGGDNDIYRDETEPDLEFRSIDFIFNRQEETTVFNLETSTGTYFANDLLVHNCHFAHTHSRGPLANKTQKPPDMQDCGDLMSVDLAGNILYQLATAGVKSATWSGGGEPTLHPQFNEVITYAATMGLDQGIYTNGANLSDEKVQALKRLFTFVYVSLDECRWDSYKGSKGVDRFDDVCLNISKLVIADGKATIGVGFLLHPGNVDDIGHMVALGRHLGVDYVQFRPIINYDQAAPSQLVEDTTWINHAINSLRAYAGDEFVQADTWRFEQYRDWRGHGYKTCNWSALQTVITPNGKVWRCTNKRGVPDGLLGDLTQDSFTDIWQRSGGACQVNDRCRVMCRGHISNQTLDVIMTEPAHANFI